MFLEFSISGFWPIVITHGVVGVASFVAGVLVARNNYKAIDARLTAAENTIDALKAAAKKL